MHSTLQQWFQKWEEASQQKWKLIAESLQQELQYSLLEAARVYSCSNGLFIGYFTFRSSLN
jgi:hypothetical protein